MEAEDSKIFTFPFICLLFYLLVEYGRLPFLGFLRPGLLVDIALAFFILINFEKTKIVIQQRHFKLFFVLIVLMTIHVPTAINNYWAFVHWKWMICYGIISLAICVFVDTEKKALVFIAFFILVNLLGALNRNYNFGIGFGGTGPMGDTNDFALEMNIAMPISFFLGLAFKGIKRYVFWTAALFFVIANVACSSRGGFVGLACVSVLCFSMSMSKIRALIIVTLASIIFWVSVPQDYKGDIESIADETSAETGTTGYGRIKVWEVAFKVFLGSPIIGVGQGNAPWHLGKYTPVGPESDWRRSQAGRVTHSVYFTVLPELGLIGILIFGLMIKDNIHKSSKVKGLMGEGNIDQQYILYGLVIGMAGYLVSGAFLSAFYYPQFWNISALITATHLIRSKHAMNEKHVGHKEEKAVRLC